MAATGVAALTTSAVKSYAEYEQLVGGIETLFGAGGDSVEEYAEKVGKSVSEVQDEYDLLMEAQEAALDNANKAYKTAGLSANDYMETVTSFAAALKQSTENELEAAEAADQAVIDMADNANKMGTSMESIQNAYQGFAKQNYTMLDNLKLGYGGTKEEMERLLADAEKLTGVKYDINNLSDVYSAIHVIQTELGITGTTAEEASTTISGSLGMVKAAWSNLLTGIADENQDIDVLIDNLVDSVTIAAENILPVAEVALNGIGDLIDQLIPVIVSKIPGLISDILPRVVASGTNIMESLIDGLQQSLPTLTESFLEIASSLASSFAEIFPSVVQMGFQFITKLLEGILESIPDLMDAGGEIISSIIESIKENLPMMMQLGIDLLLEMIQGIGEYLSDLITDFVDIIIMIGNAIIENLPQIISTIVVALINCIPALLEGAIELFMAIVEAIPEINNALVEALPAILEAILGALETLATDLWEKVLYPAITAFVEWGAEVVQNGKDAANEFIQKVIEFIKNLPENLAYWLGYAITKVVLWVMDMRQNAIDAGSAFIENVINFIKELPSKFKEWLDDTIDKIIQFKDDLISKATESGEGFFEKLTDAVKGLPDKFLEIGSNIVSGIWNGISNGWDWLISSVKDLAGSLFQGAKDALDIHSPSKKFKWIGEMCVAGFDEGMEDLMDPDDMTKNINASLSTAQMNVSGANTSGSANNGGSFQQIVNVNQQISTPDELARAIRVESRYGLMRGVALG